MKRDYSRRSAGKEGEGVPGGMKWKDFSLSARLDMALVSGFNEDVKISICLGSVIDPSRRLS